LDGPRERGLGPIGRERAEGQHLGGRDGHDDRVAGGVTREPLALRAGIARLGVGGGVGPEDLVVPDRGDLGKVRLRGVADGDGDERVRRHASPLPAPPREPTPSPISARPTRSRGLGRGGGAVRLVTSACSAASARSRASLSRTTSSSAYRFRSMAYGRAGRFSREINCHYDFHQLFFETLWTSGSPGSRRLPRSRATARSRTPPVSST